MKKRDRKIVFTVYGCFLLFAMFLKGFECCASEKTAGELVLLIDSSGTMNDSMNDVKQWANQIGAYVEGTGVKVHLIRFGEQIYSVYDDKINSENYEKYKSAVQTLSASEKWTDQATAMEEAVKILNDTQAEQTCIVMLSDGRLDYMDDTLEICGKKRFHNAIDEYLDGSDNRVLIIQFGKGKVGVKEDETYIFEELNEKVELLSSDRITDNVPEEKEILDNSLPMLLEGLGVENEINQAIIYGNPFEIRLDEGFNRTIFKIELLDGELNKSMIENIVIKKGDEAYDKCGSFINGNICFLYFQDLSAGEYTVYLPEGKWEFYEIQEKAEITEPFVEDEIETDKPVSDPFEEQDVSVNITQNEETRKVEEKIDVEEVFHVPVDDKTYYILINDQKQFILGNDDDNDTCSLKDDCLYFHIVGAYKVNIKSEDEYLETEYLYNIIDLEFWEKILFFLEKNLNFLRIGCLLDDRGLKT